MDKSNRQKDCIILADFINKEYVGKVVEVQNVFVRRGVKTPFIGIVNKATIVPRRLWGLQPNIYIDIELKTVINMKNADYHKTYSVCIPPNLNYIQPCSDALANKILKYVAEYWKDSLYAEIHFHIIKQDTFVFNNGKWYPINLNLINK